MTIELALLRAARPQLDPSKEALAQRLEQLETALKGEQRAGGTPAQHQADEPPDPPTAEPEGSGGSSVSEAGVSSAPPPSGLDLETLVSAWPGVVEQVRESGAEVLSRALEAARPIAVDAQ